MRGQDITIIICLGIQCPKFLKSVLLVMIWFHFFLALCWSIFWDRYGGDWAPCLPWGTWGTSSSQWLTSLRGFMMAGKMVVPKAAPTLDLGSLGSGPWTI